jgi:hypothetical protein
METRFVKPEDIQGYVASEHYFTAHEGVMGAVANGSSMGIFDPKWEVPKTIEALGILTFCVVVLKNGFTLTGESACADVKKFDPEVGRRIAKQNALNKAWPLMGYVLRSQLSGVSGLLEPEGAEGVMCRLKQEAEALTLKISKLNRFINGQTTVARTEAVNEKNMKLLRNQLNAMISYSDVLSMRIINMDT